MMQILNLNHEENQMDSKKYNTPQSKAHLIFLHMKLMGQA